VVKRGTDPLTAYYLATPAFAVLDVVANAPIRISALQSPAHRFAYYGVVFLLGMLCRARPRAAPWVGMLESSANLFLLLLGILLPIWSLPEAVAAGGSIQAGLEGTTAANALLVGGALVLAFHRNRLAAAKALGRGPRRGAP
jgi:hypothetical protein